MKTPSPLLETEDKGIDTNSPSNTLKVNSKNNKHADEDNHEDDDFNISFGAFPRDEEEGNNLEDENDSYDNNENKIIEKPNDNAKI